MGGVRSQHWTSQSTCRAPRRHQHTAAEQQCIPRGERSQLDLLRRRRGDILAIAAKNQPEDGPGTRRAAIRACKYLRAMVNQHGPQLQTVYDAAKEHTQRSKGSAANETTPYRPKESELPVVAPEADIGVCSTAYPRYRTHGPLPRSQLTWIAPASGSPECAASFLLTITSDIQKAHPLLRKRRIWNQRSKRSKTPSPSSKIGS